MHPAQLARDWAPACPFWYAYCGFIRSYRAVGCGIWPQQPHIPLPVPEVIKTMVEGKSTMWMGVSARREICGCTEAVLGQCLIAGSATGHLQYAGGFVRVPPRGINDGRVSVKGSAAHIILRLCRQLASN